MALQKMHASVNEVSVAVREKNLLFTHLKQRQKFGR